MEDNLFESYGGVKMEEDDRMVAEFVSLIKSVNRSDEFFREYAKFTKKMVESLEAEGFTRDEAIFLVSSAGQPGINVSR